MHSVFQFDNFPDKIETGQVFATGTFHTIVLIDCRKTWDVLTCAVFVLFLDCISRFSLTPFDPFCLSQLLPFAPAPLYNSQFVSQYPMCSEKIVRIHCKLDHLKKECI